MIKKISIEGYKSIKMMELVLRDINVLIRANGSDKSNFISYFLLIHNLYEQRLCNYTMQNNAENLVYFGLKHIQENCSVTRQQIFRSNERTIQRRSRPSLYRS